MAEIKRGGKRPGAGRKKGYRTPRTIGRQRGIARAIKQAEITAERTMLEIARIAIADRRGMWKDGSLKPLDQWTADEAALLEGLEVIRKNAEAGDGHVDIVHKVHLAKKTPALELLAKHFGLVAEKLEITASDALVARLMGARKRSPTDGA